MTYFNMKWSMRALSVLPSRSRGQTLVMRSDGLVCEEKDAQK